MTISCFSQCNFSDWCYSLWTTYFEWNWSSAICTCWSYGALTHWGWVTHICVSDLTSIGSDNGLSPGRRHAIIRTNAGILLIRPLGTNFSEFLVEILIFSFKKMRLKVSSPKWRPFCLGVNVLTTGDKQHQRWCVCSCFLLFLIVRNLFGETW